MNNDDDEIMKVKLIVMMMEMIDDYESEVDFQFHFSIVKIYFL